MYTAPSLLCASFVVHALGLGGMMGPLSSLILAPGCFEHPGFLLPGASGVQLSLASSDLKEAARFDWT